MLRIPKEEVDKLPQEISSLAKETFNRLLLFLPGEQHYKEIFVATCLEFAGEDVWKEIGSRIEEIATKLSAQEQLAYFGKELLLFAVLYARLYTFHRFYLKTVVGEAGEKKETSETEPKVSMEESEPVVENEELLMLRVIGLSGEGGFNFEVYSGKIGENGFKEKSLTLLNKLEDEGKIMKVKEGVWKITEKGMKFLEENHA